MGTSVGTEVFVQHGWRACSLLMLALYGFQMAMLLLRGPHCPRNHWLGFAGGMEARKSVIEARKKFSDSPKVGQIVVGERKEKMEDGVLGMAPSQSDT